MKATTLAEIYVARACAVDGVFLISHGNADDELLEVAAQAVREHEGFPIGLNLLSKRCVQATKLAMDVGAAMVWCDHMGVDSRGLFPQGNEMAGIARANPHLKLFAGVAFKYQAPEAHPVEAAAQARAAGFIPTTSGDATGSAPSVQKIASMGAGGALAVASGMTPENVRDYAPWLAHILVATGVARSEHHIDHGRLQAFVSQVRGE